MAKKRLTLEDLAAMMKRGLDEVHEEMGFTRKELKSDISKMDEHMRLEKFTGIDK